MKYRIESTVLEDIDVYVRITVRKGLPNELTRVTKMQKPTAIQVAEMLADMKGCGGWNRLDEAHKTLCGRVARDAADNEIVLDL